jgi:hypothetical protein
MNFLHFYHKGDNSSNPRGGNTAGYRLSDDGTEVFVATSTCSAKDRYSKRLGRELCTQRLDNQDLIQSFDMPSEVRPSDYVRFLAIFGYLKFPEREFEKH